MQEFIKLRVACAQLLTAVLPSMIFFSRQTRQRATGVYFNSLSLSSAGIKNVAHKLLRFVLGNQSHLPKELWQTDLRPIVMNPANSKRLSILGLERLLELLTNYLKVEIGHKLLDQFRIVADLEMLQMSPKLPFSKNEGIPKLVLFARIFHLPPFAHTLLKSMVNAIIGSCQTVKFIDCVYHPAA
ncbi:hypothetical protein H1R20_g14058, partial [Candolleomyces eurysporus]